MAVIDWKYYSPFQNLISGAKWRCFLIDELMLCISFECFSFSVLWQRVI